MPMAIGSAESPARTERRGERRENGGRDEKSSREEEEVEEEKEEEGTGERWQGRGGGRRRTRRTARHCSRPLARDSWLLRPGWPVASITSDTSARSFSPSASPSPPSMNPAPLRRPSDSVPTRASRTSIYLTEVYTRFIFVVSSDN